QVLQTGWVQTFPDIPGDGDWDVTLTSGQKDRANHFGNYQPPDLTITKTHTGSFKRGQTGATYTITVTNNGTGPTIGTVTVNDSLPAGLHTAGLNGEGWTCDPVTLTCTRSDALAAGDSYPLISLTVNVDQAAPDPVTNSVTVSGTGEIDTANNTGNDLTGIVSEADLSITGTGNAAAHIGYCYIYTLTVLNNGPSDVTGVSATDTLPSGATCHSSTPGKGKYDSSTGIWTIGNLASGEAASLILEIMAESLSKTDLTNTAQVTGNETDPDYDNNSLSQNTRVIIPAIGGEVIDISKSRMLAPRLSLCLIPAAGVIFLLFRRRKEN
ncbi:MAG: DUF11 domain-containing protein, partial [Dehalococcoidales bacterium]|nr:DUF11 domain-containing protein [Dehalococcoidales bacterium]